MVWNTPQDRQEDAGFFRPARYQRSQPIRYPKLGNFKGIIDAILADDQLRHKKQRHTAKRILERLREEHGFCGGYTIVKDYVREQTLRSREMFIPLAHPPGHAQADFGEAVVRQAKLGISYRVEVPVG